MSIRKRESRKGCLSRTIEFVLVRIIEFVLVLSIRKTEWRGGGLLTKPMASALILEKGVAEKFPSGNVREKGGLEEERMPGRGEFRRRQSFVKRF